MSDQFDDVPEIAKGLPDWAASVAIRLEFYSERGHSELCTPLIAAVEALRPLTADPDGNARALDRFMHTCLDLLGAAARARDDFATIRDELDALCELARTALKTDRDDRPLLARAYALTDLPGAPGWAAVNVPGRVVFLAAMVEHVPSEVGAAAAMLTNDLAAVGIDLPFRALQAAAQA